MDWKDTDRDAVVVVEERDGDARFGTLWEAGGFESPVCQDDEDGVDSDELFDDEDDDLFDDDDDDYSDEFDDEEDDYDDEFDDDELDDDDL